VPTKKTQALVAYLALTADQTHPRDKLSALLWPDTPSAAARNALRQTLFVRRKALGPAERGGLVMRGDAITLAAGSTLASGW
jgi:DNA-binding SARP family transcriptional activator